MRKLRLNEDDLRVTSFETAPAAERQGGTVHAHASEDCSGRPTCGPTEPAETDWETCQTCAVWC